MVNLPLGRSDWRRGYGEPQERLVNRYFEENPVNKVEGVSILARPALRLWKRIGVGPIQGIYSQPGSFEDALFVASGGKMYRVETDNSDSEIGDGLAPGTGVGFVRMAATSALGPGTPEMLWTADGATLWLYMANSYAFGVLTLDGSIVNNNEVEIGGVYYRWTAGDVNTGTPAGTNTDPWLVAVDGGTVSSLNNLLQAINGTGEAGVQYSLNLVEHPTVLARSSTFTTLSVQAWDVGADGDTITTAVVTGADLSWSGATLDGGGSETWSAVDVPDNLRPVAVAFIGGYILVVVAKAQGFNGRFFWIEPGETFIRPLNYATAERAPDPLHSVRVVGDQIWLFGTNTTEVWYMTGNADFPFIRTQGQMFDRGIVEGTDVQIKDVVYLTDTNGEVYALAGGQPRPIGNPSIAERNRSALKQGA